MGLRARIFSAWAEALFYRSGKTFDTVFGRCRRSFFIGFYAGGSRLCFRLRVGPYGGLSLFLSVGLALIVKGGDFFVDAAGWIAEVSGIPRFIVGATIVSFATTLPELIVSCIGAARGTNALAIGNAVGSVTANTGLIMAISIICIPAVIKRSQYALKSILLLCRYDDFVSCFFRQGLFPLGKYSAPPHFRRRHDRQRAGRKKGIRCL